MATRTSSTGSALFKETELKQWETLLLNFNIQSVPDYDNHKLKIKCIHPDHNDSKPSAVINTRYGNYHCWSCDKDTIYDPIKVIELAAGVSYGEAYDIFGEYFGMRPPKKVLNASAGAQSEDSVLLNKLVGFLNYALVSVYRDYEGDKSVYSDQHHKAIKWLKSRHISLNDVQTLFKIGILPGNSHLASLSVQYLFDIGEAVSSAPTLVDDFKLYFGKVYGATRYGALLFPHFITPTEVGRIQIRVDFLSDAPSSLKFFFVTAGDDAPERIRRLTSKPTGFFGLDTWKGFVGDSGDYIVGVTEGATDCIASYKAQFDSLGHAPFPVIAVPGTGAKEVDRLASYGIQEVRFLQDSPADQGDTVAANYIRQIADLDVSVLRWPDSQYKDISKMYLSAGADAVCDLILSDANFERSHEMVMRGLQSDVTSTGAGPEHMKKLALAKMEEIGSSAARRAFAKSVPELFPEVSGEELEKEATTIGDDTVEGFIERIKADIESEFQFLYQQLDRVTGKVMVALLKKSDNTKLRISASDRDVMELLSSPFGARTDWAVSARMPTRLRTIKSGKKRIQSAPSAIRREMNACIRSAIEGLITATPSRHDIYENLANGIHRIQKDGQEAILVVNGEDTYIGEFVAGDIPAVKWDTYFPEKVITGQRDKWTQNIKSLEDLEYGNSVSIKRVWQDIYKVVNKGWVFKHQEAAVTWITALTLYSAIYDFSHRTLFTVVTGEKESGKSRLVKDYFGGKKPFGSRMPQVEFYNYLEFPSTSEAGVRQEFAGVGGIQRRGLVLDEFENDGMKSANKMDAMFGMFRGMVDGSAKVTKGTKHGYSMTYDLRFPVVMAGILEFDDPTGAVESRIFRIETKREKGRMSPMRTIAQAYPSLDGDAVTRNLTLGVLRYAQRAREESLRILDKINYGGFAVDKLKGVSSDRPNVAAATIGGILSICGFEDDVIEGKLVKILNNMSRDQDKRMETPEDKIWSNLLSMVVPLPEKPEEEDDASEDLFSDYRIKYNNVSLNDALFEPFLRKYIGKVDFFQAFRLYDEKYLLIDRYYLRQHLKREGLSWTSFSTLLSRKFPTLEGDELRHLINKHKDLKFLQASKKLLCIELPEDITIYWTKDE